MATLKDKLIVLERAAETQIQMDFEFIESVAAEARKEIERLTKENERLHKQLDTVDYVLQDELHNRLTPRVGDIAYNAFMRRAVGKNADDGGPCDWFNDTKPMVDKAIAEIRAALKSGE
jgi:hypothetical protein